MRWARVLSPLAFWVRGGGGGAQERLERTSSSRAGGGRAARSGGAGLSLSLSSSSPTRTTSIFPLVLSNSPARACACFFKQQPVTPALERRLKALPQPLKDPVLQTLIITSQSARAPKNSFHKHAPLLDPCVRSVASRALRLLGLGLGRAGLGRVVHEDHRVKRGVLLVGRRVVAPRGAAREFVEGTCVRMGVSLSAAWPVGSGPRRFGDATHPS